jgi:hypothetical protein
MIRRVNYLLAISLIAGFATHAQTTKNKVMATVTARAKIMGNVNLIVMKDMMVEIGEFGQTNLTVDPQNDPRCGEIEIVGSPNSLVRVASEKRSVIQHESGRSRVYFTSHFAGDTLDVQAESNALSQNDEVRLGGDGTFYIWIGGEFSGLEDIIPGNYILDLTIDVEYAL